MTPIAFADVWQNDTLFNLACGKYANLTSDVAAGTAPPGTAIIGDNVRVARDKLL